MHPLTNGARLGFSGGKPSVTDGAMVEPKEVVGGYWMLEARSKQEVVDWMKRCPAQNGDVIEIRQIFELSDFPADVQTAVRERVGLRSLAALVNRKTGKARRLVVSGWFEV